MTQVFISYSRKDLVFVERLAEDLKAAGLDVWFDLSGLEGGTRWGREIQGAIQQSQIFVVVLSPNSIESEWVEKEFMYANSLKRKIIPLLYQPCETPMWFINLHFIDVQGSNYDSHFWIILKAMGVKAGEGKAKAKPLSGVVPETQISSVTPQPLPQAQEPAQPKSPRTFQYRPLWLIALLGLAALIVFALWGMPALAARLAPTSTSTPTATATHTRTPLPTSTPTQTPMPSPTFTPMPTVNPTTGTVAGSVVWGSAPQEGVLVTLCTKWLYTCTGTKFTGLTNYEGTFTISEVAPGDYQLITKYAGQKDETRQGGVGGFPLSIRVDAGQRIVLKTISMCKNDLMLFSPTIQGKTVTFVWRADPLATSYRGYLTGMPSWTTTSTLYTMNFESGNYQLAVQVIRSDRACVQGFVNFTVP